jgi:response regulator of citrate/malate metabolism
MIQSFLFLKYGIFKYLQKPYQFQRQPARLELGAQLQQAARPPSREGKYCTPV